jgi:quercetin dioxygenase-like cupin family protein
MGHLAPEPGTVARENDGSFDSEEIARMLSSDRPGMHRTATMDMILVVSGACILELDEGEVKLNAGDVLIQSGTMHAWQNPFDQPCRLLAAIVGARNDLCD